MAKINWITILGGLPTDKGNLTSDFDATWGPIPAPKKPSGSKKATVGDKVKFKTKGTDPANVHQFVFDWGDGSKMKWQKKKVEQEHKYKTAGEYKVRCKERCPLGAFQTEWSDVATIKIVAKKKK